MKPLFICNPSQVSGIKKHIEENKIFKSVKGKKLDKCFITSQSECDSRRNDFIGIGDAPSTRIYIDPFLQWGREDYYGYHIALDILTNWKKKEAPGLIFLSAIEQTGFDKLVKGKLNSFVREFIHFDFLDLKEKCLPYSTFSNSRWKYLKAYALTSSGILDDLSHDLTTIISQKESSRNSLEKLIERINNLPETAGAEVIQYCSVYKNDVNVSAFAKALQGKIQERIKEIKPHEPSSIKVPADLNILIIEDNKEHLVVLEKALTERDGYFEKDKNLFSYTNGEEALKELKASPNQYQLVLVDLRLNDENGFAQPIHGVDIIEELQKNHPLSSYTIITGMGRKGIGELLNIDVKFILSKKQLYSFDTESEVDTMLTRMLENVKQREKIIFAQYGPRTGLYRASQFKTKLSALGREEFKEQVHDAYAILEKFKAKTLNSKLTLKTQREYENVKVEELKELHTSLLAYRLVYLWLAMRKNNKLYCSVEDHDEYSQVMTDCGLTIPPKKPNNIGFSAHKIDEYDGVIVKKIDLEKIWPHENAVIDEWREKLEEEVFDKNKKVIYDNYLPLYNFIKMHFNYNKATLDRIGVIHDMKNWNFNDLEAFLNTIFDDYKQNGENSEYFKEIDTMSSDDSVYDFFDRIIFYYLPSTFEKFMNL